MPSEVAEMLKDNGLY